VHAVPAVLSLRPFILPSHSLGHPTPFRRTARPASTGGARACRKPCMPVHSGPPSTQQVGAPSSVRNHTFPTFQSISSQFWRFCSCFQSPHLNPNRLLINGNATPSHTPPRTSAPCLSQELTNILCVRQTDISSNLEGPAFNPPHTPSSAISLFPQLLPSRCALPTSGGLFTNVIALGLHVSNACNAEVQHHRLG